VIHYLCTRKHLYTLGQYLRAWAPDLRQRFQLIPYESLPGAFPPPRPGVYVFADLERLRPRGMALATSFRHTLDALGEHARILNDPQVVLRRYELLRALYDSWINSFDAYRIHEARRPRSWPVLLRREFDHSGPIEDLVPSGAAYDDALARLRVNRQTEGVIAVEFRDTADERKVYRKYGAFLFGNRLVPRHVLFSRRWCVKDTDLLEPEHIAEELLYLETFPRAEEVRRIFAIARVDYGRIDYAFYGDRMQVWEINTNPFLVYAKSAEPGAARREANERFAAQAREAFLALDAPFS
jgi:hypothetical protein